MTEIQCLDGQSYCNSMKAYLSKWIVLILIFGVLMLDFDGIELTSNLS